MIQGIIVILLSFKDIVTLVEISNKENYTDMMDLFMREHLLTKCRKDLLLILESLLCPMDRVVRALLKDCFQKV